MTHKRAIKLYMAFGYGKREAEYDFKDAKQLWEDVKQRPHTNEEVLAHLTFFYNNLGERHYIANHKWFKNIKKKYT